MSCVRCVVLGMLVGVFSYGVLFFFFKQKTAYEMRISDWSSDVCSSDLDLPPCLIDGEIVAYGKDGNPDFSSLQAVLKRGHGAQDEGTELLFLAFDLLEADGKSLAKLGNTDRNERLEAQLRDAKPQIALAAHAIGAHAELYPPMRAE